MTFRYHDYAGALEDGKLYTRGDVAELFGVGRSTARYHLDRAVEAGLINRMYGWTGQQSGWLYGTLNTLPRLEGL